MKLSFEETEQYHGVIEIMAWAYIYPQESDRIVELQSSINWDESLRTFMTVDLSTQHQRLTTGLQELDLNNNTTLKNPDLISVVNYIRHLAKFCFYISTHLSLKLFML